MKVAIVGGGVGGLVSALLLSQYGVDVTIYEKDSKIGGRLTFFEKEGFKIDQGPTIILLPEIIVSILEEAGIQKDLLDLYQCDPLYRIHFENGKSFTKYSDLSQQVEEINRVFPGDGNGFIKFMADMSERFEIGKPQILEQSFLKKKDYLNRATASSLLKLKAYRNVMSNLKQYFTHEKLRQVYGLQTLYIGGNPYTTPAIYSLVSYSEHKHGIYYLKGGYASLVEQLEEACKQYDVKIKKNSPVTKVISDDTKATHIHVHNREVEVDAVILNGDFPISDKLVVSKKKKRHTPSSGCFLLYIGIEGKYENKEIHQFYLNDDFERNMKAIFKEKHIPENPSYYVFNPSIIDESLAPDGHSSLYVLVPVPANMNINWEEEKQVLQKKILDKMERDGFEHIKSRIKWIESRTPLDAEIEGLYSGGSFGVAPSLFQSGPFRTQVQPYKQRNIFAVGASIHPGGGIPIVMQGAKNLVEVFKDEFQLYEKRGEVTLHEHFESIRTM